MKKSLSLFFILMFPLSTYCRPEKRIDSALIRSQKKYKISQTQIQSQSNLLSVDNQRDLSEMLGQLKRRYPRKYNLKYNTNNKFEADDFGFAPCYRSKKAYKV